MILLLIFGNLSFSQIFRFKYTALIFILYVSGKTVYNSFINSKLKNSILIRPSKLLLTAERDKP